MNLVLIKNRNNGQKEWVRGSTKTVFPGDTVILQREKSRDIAKVLGCNDRNEHQDSPVADNLASVLRVANVFDMKKIEENAYRENKAYQFCQQEIRKRRLDMHLMAVEFSFDRKRIKFLFTSWKKVDFRELVKTLSKEYKTAIELRQIGVRDAAKIIGGIGICGRTVCCETFLDEFKSVNLKMARVQNLGNNSEKVSGICGRLRCCIRYEYKDYMSAGHHSYSDEKDQDEQDG